MAEAPHSLRAVDRRDDDQPAEREDRRGNRLPGAAVASFAEEVVARLAQRHGEAGGISDAEIDALAEALLSDDPEAAAAMVDALRLGGANVGTLYLGHLAGAARRLGDWWVADRASFADVTIGSSRIYAIMRTLRRALAVSRARDPARVAVFAAVPGEEHTLGVSMAADLVRQSGWHVELCLGGGREALLAAASGSDCRLVGLSASGGHCLAELGRVVAALRADRPRVRILVSGHVLETDPEAVAALDIDHAPRDLAAAIRMIGLPGAAGHCS